MRLRIMSDTHFEFGRHQQFDRIGGYNNRNDILILAGDIVNWTWQWDDYLPWLEKQARDFRMVIVIAGNHEFYGCESVSRTYVDMQKKINLLDRVQFLNDSYLLLDGVAFVGSTLWTSLNNLNPVDVLACRRGLNDFSEIGGITPDSWFEMNRKAKDFYAHVLPIYRDHKDIDKVVAISHYLPSSICIHRDFCRSAINAGFVNYDMDDMIADARPDLWIYGHSHRADDFQIDGTVTRFVCNPFGYMNQGENPGFDPFKEVEL